MIGRERGIKGLDAESARVCLKALRRHQRDGPQSPDISIDQLATIIERKLDGHIFLIAGAYQQCASKARLHSESVTRRQVKHHKLRPSPSTENGGSGDTATQGACGD